MLPVWSPAKMRVHSFIGNRQDYLSEEGTPALTDLGSMSGEWYLNLEISTR